MGEPISDRLTFESVFVDEYPNMVALAVAVTGRHDHGEEIAADAFARLNDKWAKVSGYQRPGAWLRRVTINLALSRRRRLAAEVRARLRLGIRPEAVELVPPDRDEEMWAAVRGLAPRQRAVIALHYLEDRTIDEIADLLGISPATVRVHLHRAREILRRQIDQGA